jgi:hypothetical protein
MFFAGWKLNGLIREDIQSREVFKPLKVFSQGIPLDTIAELFRAKMVLRELLFIVRRKLGEVPDAELLKIGRELDETKPNSKLREGV